MDIIFLGGLEIETIIGIYDWKGKPSKPLCLILRWLLTYKKPLKR